MSGGAEWSAPASVASSPGAPWEDPPVADRKAAKPREIYLDNNATTPALPEVADVVVQAMRVDYGNPSSAHRAGRRARAALWKARERVGASLSVQPEDVVFTSGASEANNMVVLNLLRGPLEGYRFVTTAVEHSSVLAPAGVVEDQGRDVIVVPVDERGIVDQEALLEAIVPGRTLVSVQWANGETGVVQPIDRLLEEVHARDALFHTDAVQAVGKAPVDLDLVGVDFASISAHKLHGPLGVGALVRRNPDLLAPTTFGGAQEGAQRPGTENVPGAVGFGEALRLRWDLMTEVAAHTRRLRDRFEEALERVGVARAFNGSESPRLPNTSNVLFEGVDGEALVARLDRLGIRCSQSSACTNQRPEPSHVIRAMGRSEADAYASVRFAFSRFNASRDVDDAVEAIVRVHGDLARGPGSVVGPA